MRTLTLRGIFTLTFVLALSTATSYAQSHVSGTVVDAENKPIQGAVILFDMKDRAMKRETKTDKKGEYLFIGLPTGDYTVTASKDGLTDAATTNISGAAKVKVNFTLQAATVTKVVTGTGLEAAGAGKLASAERPKDKNEYAELQAMATAALEAFKANQHEEAAAKLTDVVAKMPACADCYLYLGVSLFETQKLPEAEAAFKKSVELQPSVEGYTALVRYYNSQKQFDKAEEMGKKASELAAAPVPPPPAAGAPADAAATTAPPATPGASSETAFNQGAILWNAKKYAEAKPMFAAAVQADPNNADAHYMLAMSSLNVGQIGEARTAFQNYLKVAPNGPKAAEVKTFLTQLPK